MNPTLPDDDFEGAVMISQAEFDQHQPRSSWGRRFPD
jgi:hypothetical protein